MESWRYLGVVLLGLWALGCRSGGQSELVERELRHLEDRIYCLEDEAADAEARLDSCRRENASLRKQLSQTRGHEGQRHEPSELRPPQTNLGIPQGADVPSSRPATEPLEEAPPFEGPPLIAPPESSPAEGEAPESAPPDDLEPVTPSPDEGTSAAAPAGEYDVAKLTLNKLLTGGYNPDHRGGDEGVMVVAEPRNAQGAIVDVPGEVSVVVLDPALEGDAARVARWDYAADEAADHFKKSALGEGLHFQLPWPTSAPLHADLMLFVRLTLADGRELIADREIKVKLPLAGEGSGEWTAPSEPLAEPALPDEPAAGEARLGGSMEAVPSEPSPRARRPAPLSQTRGSARRVRPRWSPTR